MERIRVLIDDQIEEMLEYVYLCRIIYCKVYYGEDIYCIFICNDEYYIFKDITFLFGLYIS